MSNKGGGFFAALNRYERIAEDAVLVLLLGGMIVLAAAQIIMRNAFDTGLVWSDELLRLGVLWVALVGAVAASRDDHHISIDVLSRFLPPRLKHASSALVALFTSVVCGLLAWYSLDFLRESIEYEDVLLGDLPAWWFQLILPLGFGLIAYRYLVHTSRQLINCFSPSSTEPDSA